ncbi:hypothetical protein ABID65_009618 [Bradyrhizobium sp. S3.9.2]
MDSRNARSIRDILLSKRELEAVILYQADSVKPSCSFADQMRDATQRVTRGYVADPLPKNRCLLKSLAPERVCEFGGGVENCLKLRVRDLANTRRANAHDVMVEYPKLEGLQIWEISRNMETEDLLAIADDFVSGNKTTQDDGAVRRYIAFTTN